MLHTQAMKLEMTIIHPLKIHDIR